MFGEVFGFIIHFWHYLLFMNGLVLDLYCELSKKKMEMFGGFFTFQILFQLMP